MNVKFIYKQVPPDLEKAITNDILRILADALKRQRLAESSNGRTAEFESVCVGSIPTSSTFATIPTKQGG